MMAQQRDWKSSLTASERYENIEKIQKALSTTELAATAFTLENEIYQSSIAREDYDAACVKLHIANSSSLRDGPPHDHEPPAEQDDHFSNGNTGTRIGQYADCHYVASGVTAEVYRCRERALKVIVETRDIEPHNPFREAKILGLLKKPCIPLLETFRDREQRFVLVFPYMPLTLAMLLEKGRLTDVRIKQHFRAIFNALASIHELGIIHRDIKPSAILLDAPDGQAYLSDFGTAWHPQFSATSEPAASKILDIGTGPYRAPEVLFGNKAYGPAVDLWGAGTMLAECCRRPPSPLFESRPVHEDGNQLGLILSIFKTIGSPTLDTWPEATSFKTPPFEMYQVFTGKSWVELLPGVNADLVGLIGALVRYDSKRATAREALDFKCLQDT